METVTITLPYLNEVDFRIICSPEYVSLKQGMIEDPTSISWITKQLENGNQWAWCSVEVEASWKGISSSDYLGCCAYESEDGFKTGGYYLDMKQTSFESLINQIRSLSNGD